MTRPRLQFFATLVFALLFAVMTAAEAAVELLGQPNMFLHANGAVMAIVGVLLLAWPIVAWRRAAAREMARGEG